MFGTKLELKQSTSLVDDILANYDEGFPRSVCCPSLAGNNPKESPHIILVQKSSSIDIIPY